MEGAVGSEKEFAASSWVSKLLSFSTLEPVKQGRSWVKSSFTAPAEIAPESSTNCMFFDHASRVFDFPQTCELRMAQPISVSTIQGTRSVPQLRVEPKHTSSSSRRLTPHPTALSESLANLRTDSSELRATSACRITADVTQEQIRF